MRHVAGAVSLPALSENAPWAPAAAVTLPGPNGPGAECTPGHTEGDPACDQIRHDEGVRTWFDGAGTSMLITFTYPCGWSTTTREYDDRIQTNVTRSGIGDEDAYVDVQIRTYFEPVTEGFLEDKKAAGDYDELTYQFAGEKRTGLVSSIDTAQYGTTAHAVVPGRRERDGATFQTDSLFHVELISTLKGADCSTPPDYRVVTDTLRSIEPNTPASVRLTDQKSVGTAITVERARLFTGGYVVVYETAGLDAGQPGESILGTSPYIAPGTTTTFEVTLEKPITETTDVTARVHADTNDNQRFDYYSSSQQEDVPVVYEGAVVSDTATIESARNETATQTPPSTTTQPFTGTPTRTPTAASTTVGTATPSGATRSGESGQGYGIGTAVSGILLAALLFVRRRLRAGDE